ncbi:MAG: hypothetical protein EOL86_13870 [Deltaproteobacteria bacterium]|nr:hypothetical protein [Deltaproteobacteria bacterium]
MKRILLILLAMAAAGAAFWFWKYQNRPLPQPVAREVAPQRWQVSGTSAMNATNATGVHALNATNATLAENATTANATLASPEDTVVGHGFVQDLSRYLVSAYHPAKTKRNPSDQAKLALNLKSLNIRYGVDFPGLNVDPMETLKARQTIFAHVFTPTVLEFLQNIYVPLFLDNLEEALRDAPRVLASGQQVDISEAQRQEMLNLLAAKMRTVGKTVATLARTANIQELVGKYLADMEKVNEAHITFWNLQTDNASVAAVDQASIKIKAAIQTREMSRQRLLQTIVATANPQGLDASELIYLAQWIHRRGLDNPALLAQVAKAGDLAVKTATALEERAKQPRPAQNPTNATREERAAEDPAQPVQE